MYSLIAGVSSAIEECDWIYRGNRLGEMKRVEELFNLAEFNKLHNEVQQCSSEKAIPFLRRHAGNLDARAFCCRQHHHAYFVILQFATMQLLG
jgi:hypothetical protein